MRATSWLTPVPPTVAIELASHRVTVVEVPQGAPVVSAFAAEPLPDGAIAPALSGPNIADPRIVTDALARALDRAGLASARRAALVVPDSVARVSLLPFDQLPPRAADLDKLVRWQLRKATPFPLDDAQVSHFEAGVSNAGRLVAAVVMRREVLAEYESVVSAAGIHPGIVDLASFNVMNAAIASGAAGDGDWLIVHLAAEATTLAILRGSSLLFYRHRSAVDQESLGALVHQTAMYHEDRLGGGVFTHVWLSGAGRGSDDARWQISSRLGVPVETIDFRPAADVRDRESTSPEAIDAITAGVGVLVRERRGA